MPKNFDQSESWKIEFHCRHQHYIPFKSACSTEFKNVLGSKISENDDFLRKKFSNAQISLNELFTRFSTTKKTLWWPSMFYFDMDHPNIKLR